MLQFNDFTRALYTSSMIQTYKYLCIGSNIKNFNLFSPAFPSGAGSALPGL